MKKVMNDINAAFKKAHGGMEFHEYYDHLEKKIGSTFRKQLNEAMMLGYDQLTAMEVIDSYYEQYREEYLRLAKEQNEEKEKEGVVDAGIKGFGYKFYKETETFNEPDGVFCEPPEIQKDGAEGDLPPSL